MSDTVVLSTETEETATPVVEAPPQRERLTSAQMNKRISERTVQIRSHLLEQIAVLSERIEAARDDRTARVARDQMNGLIETLGKFEQAVGSNAE